MSSRIPESAEIGALRTKEKKRHQELEQAVKKTLKEKRIISAKIDSWIRLIGLNLLD